MTKELEDIAHSVAMGKVPMRPETEALLKYFTFAHLPEHLQKVSLPFYALAVKAALRKPESFETTACLRKLLEAKDCAVRATLE